MIFHEFTAINIIKMYSHTILTDMNSEGPSIISTASGVTIIIIADFLAHLAGVFTVRKFGRRPLLIWGHWAIAFIYLSIAIF